MDFMVFTAADAVADGTNVNARFPAEANWKNCKGDISSAAGLEDN